MIELVKLHHVSFAVADLERSRRFFGQTLGLPEIERPGFDFGGAWYALGDRQLHLIERPGEGGGQGAPNSRADHMALEVRDVDAVRRTLQAAGVEFGEGSNRALGMEQIFCRDPDGHTLEFVRYHNSPAGS